jgi:hypothetical protein
MSKEKAKPDEVSVHSLTDHTGYISAIGMILIETVDLELALASLFSGLVALPMHIGHAIFLTPKGEQARLDMLINTINAITIPPGVPDYPALEEERVSARKRVLALASKCQKAINMRHRIVHDGWMAAGTEIQRHPINGKLMPPRETVSLEELQNHLYLLRKTIDQATELGLEFLRNRTSMRWMMKSSTN